MDPVDPIEYLPLPGAENKVTDRNRQECDGFYSSSRWMKVRKYFLAKSPLCARCKANGWLRGATIAHHVVPRLELPEAQWFDLGNLEALCGSCHTKHHNAEKRSR